MLIYAYFSCHSREQQLKFDIIYDVHTASHQAEGYHLILVASEIGPLTATFVCLQPRLLQQRHTFCPPFIPYLRCV